MNRIQERRHEAASIRAFYETNGSQAEKCNLITLIERKREHGSLLQFKKDRKRYARMHKSNCLVERRGIVISIILSMDRGNKYFQ